MLLSLLLPASLVGAGCFGYAAGSGLLSLMRKMNQSKTKATVSVVLLLIISYGFHSLGARFEPATTKLLDKLVDDRGHLAHASYPFVRMNELLLSESSFFAHHAAWSHLLSLLLGVAVQSWVATLSQGAALMMIFMDAIFFSGAYGWFRVVLHPLASTLPAGTFPLPALLLTGTDSALLGLSHTICFMCGHLIHEDFIRHGLHKRPEIDMVRRYSAFACALSAIPFACELALAVCGVGMSASISMQVKALVMPVVFGFFTARLRFSVVLAAAWGILSWPGQPLLPLAARALLDTSLDRDAALVAASVPVTACLFAVLATARAALTTSGNSGDSSVHQDAQFAAKMARRRASYIAPYPNSWYKLCDSKDLAVGEVKYIQAVGQDLAVFRGEDGSVAVLDAYCPHLGANLAVGGVVRGNCLECPFHKWTFAKDGSCTDIPWLDKVPSTASTHAWPTREWCNMILFYFDAEHRDAPYEPVEYPEVHSDQWAYRGSYGKTIAMHLQEFAENSADFQHFDPLHGQMMLPFTQIPIPGVRIQHNASWSMDETRPYVAHFDDHAHLVLFGTHYPESSAPAHITFIGPGAVVTFRFTLPQMGEILLFQTHLPSDSLCQDTQFRWYAEKSIPRLLVWYVVGNWISQWYRDLEIWENKVFMKKPCLVSGDGPVMQMRRWYKQFYSESSADVGKVSTEW